MKTEFETLLYREENGVAYVTLNRPEVQNSFDYVMIDELAEVWQALRSHDAVRCVVLTGAGEKAFCAGGDLKEMAGTALTVPPPDFVPQFGR